MAFYDWNHDGKKDWQDNYIEYQIYKNSTGQKNNSSYTPSNGISTFGAIGIVILCISVIKHLNKRKE